MSENEKNILNILAENQDRLEEKLDKLIIDVELTKGAIIGGRFQGDGLLKRMTKVEECVNKQKNINYVIAAVFAFIAGVAAFFNQIKNLVQ